MANEFRSLIEKQRTYFKSGITRSFRFRLQQLNFLRSVLKKNETALCDALHADLHKSWQESYMTEIGPVLAEQRFIRNHLKEWMRVQHVPGMIYSFPSKGMIMPEPYGTVLIISPWNYPVWLSLNPILGAIAAGNCVMLKPSELSSHTSAALKKMFIENFPAEFISVVAGGPEISQELIDLPPDYLFFTGSIPVGKIVAQAAAKNLVPVTLELGGKSPCVIDESADLSLAAKRITWGKCITAGQTCVAPDYLLVHRKIKDHLIREIKNALDLFYPEGALKNAAYPSIISDRHYQRLKGMMKEGKILLGGNFDDATMKIEPTLFADLTDDSMMMKEEIFGPLLPVIIFDSLDEVVETIGRQPNPLAFYIFSGNKKFCQQLLREIPFGGASVNDTIEHLGNPYLPFGGIGNSGTGAYHGKYSFDTFTHYKSVMKKATWIDLNLRYLPLTSFKKWMLRNFLR